MENTELGELVKLAKGDDRSLREYAKDSGVDPAIVSKMISGNYTPKKTDVFRKLTSPQAAPRGGVTFEKLIKAADSSRSYQDGIAAGLAATSAVLAEFGVVSLGMLYELVIAKAAAGYAKRASGKKESPSEELTVSGDKMLMFEQKQLIFKKAAVGLILTELAKMGISCKVEDVKQLDINRGRPDEYLVLSGQAISEWWMTFWCKDEDLDKRVIVALEDRAQVLISRYTVAPADPSRKISIVVDDTALFNELIKYKSQTSYRGEMSIILVDTGNLEVAREEYVAHFDEADTAKELYVV